MKLKRYVLLDNNRIVDRTKLNPDISSDYLMIKILAAIENEEENVCRKLIATSDDATDLIRENDLVVRDDLEDDGVRVYMVVKMDDGTLGIITDKGYFHSIKDIKKYINRFYKLINKDYIYVWEKGKENGNKKANKKNYKKAGK